MSYELLMYQTPSGKPVVEQFLRGLQQSTRQKANRQFRLLMEFGPGLGMPHSKPLGDGLFELRVRGDQEVRVFYVFAVEQTVYLLHGFQKKSQATPKRELDLARQRQGEVTG